MEPMSSGVEVVTGMFIFAVYSLPVVVMLILSFVFVFSHRKLAKSVEKISEVMEASSNQNKEIE